MHGDSRFPQRVLTRRLSGCGTARVDPRQFLQRPRGALAGGPSETAISDRISCSIGCTPVDAAARSGVTCPGSRNATRYSAASRSARNPPDCRSQSLA